MFSSKRGLVATIVLVGAAAVAALLFILSAASNRTATGGVNTGVALVEGGEIFDGVTIYDPPQPLSDFTLTSHTNEPFSLSDLRGKAVLLYFGYTRCPDFCPLTMLEFKQVKKALGEQADQVAFVFISVDGARDTPAVLANFIARFDPDFIALTGDEPTLRRIGADYNLQFAKVERSGSDNYLVDHTASTFLIAPDGRLVERFAFGTDAGVIAEQIRARLAA